MVTITGSATIEVDDNGFTGSLNKDFAFELDNNEFYRIIYPELPANIQPAYGDISDAIDEIDADSTLYELVSSYIISEIDTEINLSCDIELDNIDIDLTISQQEYETELKLLKERRAWPEAHRG